jgi:hypothetical protein
VEPEACCWSTPAVGPASDTAPRPARRGRDSGNLVGDAHLAALALERGATVVSFDRDFARFEGFTCPARADAHSSVQLRMSWCVCAWYVQVVPKSIQIRGLDDDVYAALVRRAAETGISVPELLRAEAVRLAARPSMETWLERTRRRSSPVGRAEVLAALDEQRGAWPDAGG